MKKLQVSSASPFTISIKSKKIHSLTNRLDYSILRESFNQLLKTIPKSSGTLIISTIPSNNQLPTTLALLSSKEDLRDSLRQKGINYLKNILSNHSITKIQIQLAYAD